MSRNVAVMAYLRNRIVLSLLVIVSALLTEVSSVEFDDYQYPNETELYDESYRRTREKRQFDKYSASISIATIAIMCSSQQSQTRNSSKYKFNTLSYYDAKNLIGESVPENLRAEVTLPSEKTCVIQVKSLSLNHSLIIDPQDHTQFLYPDENGHIYFTEDDPVFLSCGMGKNVFSLIPTVSAKVFKCVCGQTFRDGKKYYNFNNLHCADNPQYEIVDKGVEYYKKRVDHKYEVGFYTDARNSFLKLYEVHYDDEVESTVYVKSIVSKSIAGGQNTYVRIPFDAKSCCRRARSSLDEAFDEGAQRQSFTNQLVSERFRKVEERRLKLGTNYVFGRSYLTPKSTMVYSIGALATYTLHNLTPQWKIIRDSNWASIEEYVLDLARVLKKDLVVYTGVDDQLKLMDDITGVKKIHLHAHNENEKTITKFPIGLSTYKVVVDPESKRGVAFVTLNNPYIDPGVDFEFCKPITIPHAMQILKWSPNITRFGYSYMCTVQDFVKEFGIDFGDRSLVCIEELLYIPHDHYRIAYLTTETPIDITKVTTTTEYKRAYYDELK